MLSAAKVRIHGMQDENWVIKDKINQYRGLIKLYERDRRIHEGDLTKQKRRYSRDIRQLRKDINVKREQLGLAVYGDKQFLRNAFQEHRRLQLMYMNSQADKVLESLNQENFNKRKQLDRIRYTKKKKMEKFRQLQLESADLRDRLLYESAGKLPAEKREQAVANYVQKANIKKNAALAIKVMYKKILDILKKDTSYFTVVLEALKLDCRAQGKCLMGATEMGQLAMEYLDDRKFEYNKLEHQIKTNMKERERTLKLVRRELTYLTESLPNLMRKEEFGNIDDLYEDEDQNSAQSIHWFLDEVMGICKKLQRATLVSSFDEILPRLKEQNYQSERLMVQLQQNSLKRDALLEDRKHAILMLDSLKNVGQESTAFFRKSADFDEALRLRRINDSSEKRQERSYTPELKKRFALVRERKMVTSGIVHNAPEPRRQSRYIQQKETLRAQLDAEKRQELELIKSLDDKGKLIIEMKTSLQQINQLLSSVEAPTTVQRPINQIPPALQYAVDEVFQPVPEVEADFDKLIQNARQKLNLLMQALAKMEVTPELKVTAKNFYHNIVARSMRENYKEEAVIEGGLIEFEMEDPNVPNHALIKLRSKQLVDSQVSEFDVPDLPVKK